MSQYPGQGQDPNQPGQYSGVGHDQTQYRGTGDYGATPQQQSFQQPGAGYQQPGYQQPGYQQPQQPYQQPGYQQPPQYAQSPYQQSPYPQAPAIKFEIPNIVAGIGAIIAIIAFFLPLYGSASVYGFVDLRGLMGGRIWFHFLVALAVLVMVLLLQFGDQLFGTTTNPQIQRLMNSLKTQKKTWYAWMIGIGGFMLFYHFILDIGRISLWGVGSWLYLLSMGAVLAGGILFFKPITSATPSQPQPYVGGQQPFTGGQQPPYGTGQPPYQPPTGPNPGQPPM